MTPRTEPSVPVALVLRCPECGNELPGLDADRVWACAPCGRAWEVEGDRLAARRFVAWRVRVAPPVLWLPFWRVAYDAVAGGDDPQARDAIARAAAPGRAWVRAWSLRAAFSQGDPGLALTELDAEESLDSVSLPMCVGGRVTALDAVRLAELFVLSLADREHDVTRGTLDFRATDVSLVAVPYSDRGREIVGAVDGRAYRAVAVRDIDAIRAARPGWAD